MIQLGYLCLICQFVKLADIGVEATLKEIDEFINKMRGDFRLDKELLKMLNDRSQRYMGEEADGSFLYTLLLPISPLLKTLNEDETDQRTFHVLISKHSSI